MIESLVDKECVTWSGMSLHSEDRQILRKDGE